MRKKFSVSIKSAIVILVPLLLISLLFGCYKEKENEGIVIGLVADLTGPMALYGGWVKKGAQIAINEISAQGGVNGNYAELKVEDSQSSPKSAVSAMQKLVTIDNIRFIVTGNGSSATMAMAPIANNKHAILFATLASSPSISLAGDYVFRNRLNGIFEAKKMAELAHEKGLQRVAVAAINNEAGVPYIDAFQKVFEKKGGQVVFRELLSSGQTDFRTQVLSLRAAKPDAVFLVLQIEQAGYIMKQSAEIGFKPKWLGISSLKSNKLIKIVGHVAEGTIIASEGIDESNTKYMAFQKVYKKRYGEIPTIYAVNGYDAVMLLATIIGRVGSNPEKVKTALYELSNYVGAGGDLRFDSNGDAIKKVNFFVVQAGKFTKI